MSTYAGTDRFRPSPVFFLILGVTATLGWLLWSGQDPGGLGVFLFVAAGWVLSLTLHEFGHAAVAYGGGDHSVADKGYLTLDVRRYADLGTSLLFPLLILVIGGIGLPGGAVWINHAAIPDKIWRSMVSAAGPAATAICALACLMPIRLGLLDSADPRFVVALGFLGWIQVIAMILNLLPIPGLDGFGIIEPHLSAQARSAVRPLRQYGMMILLVALWVDTPVRDAFWNLTDGASEFLGGPSLDSLRVAGWYEFRFWEN